MSLQFVFGNSGSGKSGKLYESILRRAGEHPDQNFIILVPEQFTMQTQRELVERQKNHAIMNVDVLSFARLAYRVFDELGKQELVVLEETGKNLVLRKVAEQKKNELTVLRGSLNKMGYISEIKSLISELTQYNISPDLLNDFLKENAVGEALLLKMQDILVIYRGFREYLQGNYITSEEVLSLLADVAAESALIRDSVIVCDEFTGFTPIQNRLLQKLFLLAKEVIVSVTIDVREDFYRSRGIHELFALSKKTVRTLMKMAREVLVEVKDPVILKPSGEQRFAGAPELFFMEQNLFRVTKRAWEEETKQIRLYAAKNPRVELTFAAKEITRLIQQNGYLYRDIAVVTGDVPQYANYVPEIFGQYKIPYFIDQTRSILFHPFIELIRAALEVIEYDFSYESVFRFLRCGMASIFVSEETGETIIDEDDIDRLENYVLAKGIRGRKRWSRIFTPIAKDADTEEMLCLNRIRKAVVLTFEPLVEAFLPSGKGERKTVAEQTYALYRFLCSLHAQQNLKKKELSFEADGNPAKAKEYAQIYRIVMDLLDKITSLLGDEIIPVREFGDILDAGLEAAKVGIIPPGNDRVTIGDIERTRLNHIKILFFVGVNDGIVPKSGGAGGIISQFEREKIKEQQLELAPGAREKVFIQKFYLYLNLTKPSDALYVTYAKTDADGKALRPSYLISALIKLFPKLCVAQLAKEEQAGDILTPENALQFFIEGLQKKEFTGAWAALAGWYFSSEEYAAKAGWLIDAACTVYKGEPIGRAVTRALYGTVLENSVTRLERFAACAFSHYLAYGLLLKERQLLSFASVDMGNIYHDVLERFANRIQESEYTWFDLPKELQERWVEECMEESVLSEENTGAFEEARNRYLLGRMKETLKQTVWALIAQIQKGKFVPRNFEIAFSRENKLSAIHFNLSEEEKMHLRGRIDRIDTYETDDAVYVKIIDYKSGSTSFSLLNLYYGLQLQLVVYLNAALELVAREHPQKNAKPAGIFYYHVTNPMVDGSGAESEEEIRQAVLEQLKLNGMVNEDESVYRAMDESFSGSSSVIPVAEKTDGSLKAASKTLNAEEFQMVSAYVNEVIKKTGRQIFHGVSSVRPYLLDGKSGCDYCPYHTVCGFDARLPGYEYNRLKQFGNEEVLESMRGGTADGNVMDAGTKTGH